jgi:hypothetical protein
LVPRHAATFLVAALMLQSDPLNVAKEDWERGWSLGQAEFQQSQGSVDRPEV